MTGLSSIQLREIENWTCTETPFGSGSEFPTNFGINAAFPRLEAQIFKSFQPDSVFQPTSGSLGADANRPEWPAVSHLSAVRRDN
jgi:hypothetical protein